MALAQKVKEKPVVVAVSVSDRKGVVKENVPRVELVVAHGVKGDAHAEGGKRQVSLLAIESIDKMRAAGAEVKPGDFAKYHHPGSGRGQTARGHPHKDW